MAPFTLASHHPLPTPEELFALVAELLQASGKLAPAPPSESDQTAPEPLSVMATLSPAWSNIDFDPELSRLPPLDRAYTQRQIERTHRDHQLQPERPYPWVLRALPTVPLSDHRIFVQGGRFRVLLLEVPVISIDRRCAVLRGQYQQPEIAEDFEHWCIKDKDTWTLAP